MTTDYVQRHLYVNKKVEDFYEQNQDLNGVREFVGAVATQVQGENPEWDIDKVFEETAKQARERLGLKAVAAKKGAPSRSPAFAGGKGAQRTRAKQTPQQAITSEIEGLVDL
jgi:hypothetical protein